MRNGKFHAFDQEFGDNLNFLLRAEEVLDVEEDSRVDELQPTKKEIRNFIAVVRKKSPLIDLAKVITVLYNRLELPKEEPLALSTNRENGCREDEANRPKFQIREIVPKQRSKLSKKDQEQRDWLKEKPQDRQDQKLNSKVWDRFNRNNREDKSDRMSTISRINKPQNIENLNKSKQWDLTTQNKTFRFYCSKVAPKFNSKDEEMKYYQKRLAAKAFVERGYGLGKAKEEYFQERGNAVSSYYATPAAPVHQKELPPLGKMKPFKPKRPGYRCPDKRRYKTVSTAFIAETLRKFEIFIMDKVDKGIRPFTGPEMRALFSVLLNAQYNFTEDEYRMFRRFVKITFDLGSATIELQPAKSLYRSIQIHLQDRLQNPSDTQSMTSEYGNWSSHNQNMRAYSQSVGCVEVQQYEQLKEFAHEFIEIRS